MRQAGLRPAQVIAKSRLGSLKYIETAQRDQLLEMVDELRATRNEWLRRLITTGRRIDVLMTEILGYTIAPNIHARIIRHQAMHKQSLTLVYRGAGKTTTGTIGKAIQTLLWDRNARILLASKTAGNASGFLTEIKGHFETNEKLIEVFGNLVGDNRWSDTQIEVRGRTRPMKEPSINTVGVDGAIASKHYDVILCDDLEDEENTRTKAQREKKKDWLYKVLLPTLRPPAVDCPYRGELHYLGTRFHYDDLYGHLQQVGPDGSGGEMKDSTLVIPAMNKDGSVPWPEMHPQEWIAEKKRTYGLIRFNSQYLCDTEAMKGQIFQIDDCEQLPDDKLPPHDAMVKYMGVDLAIGQDEQHDMFAIVVIGKTADMIVILDYFEGQLTFAGQTAKILEYAKKWNPARTAIEANAYQKAQYQTVKVANPWLNIYSVITIKDKIARAWNRAKDFENKKVKFRLGQMGLVEHLVLFPEGRYKDLFDAYDMACTAANKRKRRRRSKEPGLL
jgi:phage terminase large subunit-like protein